MENLWWEHSVWQNRSITLISVGPDIFQFRSTFAAYIFSPWNQQRPVCNRLLPTKAVQNLISKGMSMNFLWYKLQLISNGTSDGAGKRVDSHVAPILLQVDWKRTYFMVDVQSRFDFEVLWKNLPSLTIARLDELQSATILTLPVTYDIPSSLQVHPMPWHLPTSDVMSNAAGEQNSVLSFGPVRWSLMPMVNDKFRPPKRQEHCPFMFGEDTTSNIWPRHINFPDFTNWLTVFLMFQARHP